MMRESILQAEKFLLVVGWPDLLKTQAESPISAIVIYSAFTETGATQTMKTSQMAEVKQ